MFSLATHMWKNIYSHKSLREQCMATISGSKIKFCYPGAKRRLKYFFFCQMENYGHQQVPVKFLLSRETS